MKMGKMKSAIIACTALLASLSAHASGNSIAYVDMRNVIEGSKHFAEMQNDMQKKLGTKHEELILAQKNFNSEQESLEKQKAVMASSTYKKKQGQLQEKKVKLAEQERAFQEQAMKMQDESMKKLYAAVKDATKEVAKKRGFDVVLQGEPLYIANNNDITASVKKIVESKKL